MSTQTVSTQTAGTEAASTRTADTEAASTRTAGTAPAVSGGTTAEAAEQAVAGLFGPAGHADPYPFYETLRELGPVHRSAALPFSFVTTYAGCEAVLRDPGMLKSSPEDALGMRGLTDWEDHPALVSIYRGLLMQNPPEHTRLRRLVSKAFTPRTVAALRPAVERLVHELLDALPTDGSVVDLVDTVFAPLPVTVIGELLGIPAEDRMRFRPLTASTTQLIELVFTREDVVTADAAVVEMQDYFRGLAAARRADPRDDLVSALVAVEDEGTRLDEAEMLSLLGLLFAAGFETTSNLFGNGLLALLDRPDQLALLRDDPTVTATAVEELLRFDSPVQLSGRMAAADTEVEGVLIPAGHVAITLLGAGNRDPRHVADPDRLDLTRPDARPLSFGGGIHYCLGAPLARLEAELGFPELLRRFPRLELAGEPVRRPGLGLRGFASVPVVLQP